MFLESSATNTHAHQDLHLDQNSKVCASEVITRAQDSKQTITRPT